MLRVAAWTGGLFAIGAGVAHYFPGSWTEPLVLAALGAAMLLLGRDAHATTASNGPAAQQSAQRAERPTSVARTARVAR
jgi:hypothetical protein